MLPKWDSVKAAGTANHPKHKMGLSGSMKRDAQDPCDCSPSVRDAHQAGDRLKPAFNKFSGAINRVDEDGNVRADQGGEVIWQNKAIRQLLSINNNRALDLC